MIRIFSTLFLIFVLMFLLGCTINPNKNLIEAQCCYQSNETYSCSLSPNPIEGTSDLFEMIECGDFDGIECKYFNKSSGEVLDKNKNKILYAGSSNPIRPNDCSKNCNFDKANCTNEDEKNTCYSLSNPRITYPICVNVSSFNCIQNDCKIFMCGEKKQKIKKEFSFSPDETNKLENSYKSSSGGTKSSIFEVDKGLVGKVCEFRYINESTMGLLTEKNWLVNNLRIGFLGSFSDFEVARYYFPPSDVFCTRSFGGEAVVDRFFNYLEFYGGGLKKLKVFQNNFKAPLNFCSENQSHYFCMSNPSISFPKSSDYSKILCFNFCSKIFNKELFKELEFKKINVLPPTNIRGESLEHYYLDPSVYVSALMREYPEEAKDYYRKTGEKGIGPEGAKVFECLSDNDCLSSRCIKSQYLRGSCFLNDNSSISCNCSFFNSCKDAFLECPSDRSIEDEECKTGLNLCNLFSNFEKKPVVLCKYNPTTYDLYAYYDYGKNYLFLLDKRYTSATVRGESSWDGDWGVYDFDEFNKYKKTIDGKKQQVEFANIVKKVSEYGCIDNNFNKIVVPSCPNNYFFDSKDKICRDKNNNTAQPSCKNGMLGPQDWVVWKDNIEILSSKLSRLSNQNDRNDEMRWEWRRAFVLVPPFQLVSTEGAEKTIIISSRNVSFSDLKQKFDFIEKCDLKATDNINNFNDPTFDILEISIKKIPLQNHSLIEQYVTPFSFHPYYMEEEKGEFLFDKMWVIRNLGKCKKEENLDILKTRSYGVCDSCGTFVTLAYQKVNSTPISYCPSNCFVNFGNCKCNSNLYSFLPSNPFVVNLPDSSPSTIPDFNYLISKIHNYLENNVIVVLDLKEYSKAGISMGGNTVVFERELDQLPEDNPYCVGDLNYYCKETNSEGLCVKWIARCSVKTLPDFLFLFLNSKHSAVISILDTLTSSNAYFRISNARNLCPSCILALEHEQIIKIKNDTNISEIYFTSPNNLNSSLYSYFGIKFPTEENIGFPPILDQASEAKLKSVDVIVLNLDLSYSPRLSSEKEKSAYYLSTVKKAAELSRQILIHLGKPTLWKLRIDKNTYFRQSSYMDPLFFDMLFLIEDKLTLSGVIGILLPSLFEQPENIVYSTSELKDQPFINLVNGSLSYLQFSADVSTLLVNAQNKSASELCVNCPSSDPSLCKSDCEDGSSCPGKECPRNYISITYCKNNLCEEKFSSKKIVCYYIPSSSKYFTEVKKLEIESMEELFTNPDFGTILGMLNEKCCLNQTTKDSENYYTFFSHPILSYDAEEVVYPHFGANTTNCGKVKVENYSSDMSCSPSNPPSLSYSPFLYYCYWENK
ncbi:MAG: hypothetical protein QXV83_03915 [Candidatus Anstonellaceae archaeon]